MRNLLLVVSALFFLVLIFSSTVSFAALKDEVAPSLLRAHHKIS